jgi:O-methyltransferase
MSFSDILSKPAVVAASLERRRLRASFREIYRRFRAYTMVHEEKYINNLELCFEFREIASCVVECGVWRGGMIAGMAAVLGAGRQYFLFDSFEGLPPAREDVDGAAAVAYQTNTESPNYENNCVAAEEDAAAAMKLSGATSFSLIRGWFSETIPQFTPPSPIAVLRLDGDWYDSTRVCLENLYPRVAPGGIVIIDDYYNWDGCARAVNEFIANSASPNLVPRLRQFRDRAAYIVKPRAAERGD